MTTRRTSGSVRIEPAAKRLRTYLGGELVADTIKEVIGRMPELSTSGGTSDARFIKDYCPVVEFGLVGLTMHQTDERVPVADLVALTAVYRRILEKYFGK